MSSPDDMARQLEAIWEKSRPDIAARIDAIENAAVTLRSQVIDDEQRRDAERQAHKLAGAAGSFGRWKITELAREAEELLEGTGPIGPESARRLSEIAVSLRQQFES